MFGRKEMQSHSPITIVCRLQDSPDEHLDVTTAFAKRPDLVRNALLGALRHVQLRSIDITLLQIESVFLSTLTKAWSEPKILRPVLEACRQDKIKSRAERFFFAYGKEYGVVALCVATREDDHKLFREIDSLRDDELIKLVENILKIPRRASLVGFVEEFDQSARGVVCDPPPRLPRPRTRRNEISPKQLIVQSPHSPNNKKRRLASNSYNIPQKSSQIISRLPSLDDITLSVSGQSLLPPPTVSVLPAPSNFQCLPICKHTNIQPQSAPAQEGRWVLPQIVAPYTRNLAGQVFTQGQPGRYDSRQRDEQWAMSQTPRPSSSTQNPFQSEITSLQEQWVLAKEDFTQVQPYSTKPIPIDLEAQWLFTDAEFTQGRPGRYEAEPLQIDQEAQWLFTDEEFTRGRPGRYEAEPLQIDQEAQWLFTDGEITQGQPGRYEAEPLQIDHEAQWTSPGGL